MVKRAQSANRLTEAMRHAVRMTVRAANVRHLLIACSGGPDSVCLLDVIAHVARQEGWTITVGHVRHGVRVGDDADVALVRGHADRLALPFHSVSLTRPEAGGGSDRSEGVLRARRYRALLAIAGAVNAEAILTGHTLDDQAETVLLHLLRGAGLDGLSGMNAVAAVPVDTESVSPIPHEQLPASTRLVRPLLSVHRAETVAYCIACNLPVITDPSNADTGYTRNWVRHAVLPLLASRFGNVPTTLARSASVLTQDARYLAEQTDAALTRTVRGVSDDLITLDATALHAEHPALQRRILRAVLQRLTGHVPRASDVDELFRALVRSQSSVVTRIGAVACCHVATTAFIGAPHVLDAAVLAQVRNRHPLFDGETDILPDAPFEFPPHGEARTRDTLIVRRVGATYPDTRTDGCVLEALLRLPEGGALTLRTRRPGDRFRPAGRPHALRVQDYLTEQRVPALVRDRLPLLVVDGTIAWLIGYDVSAAFAATPETASHRAIVVRDDR